MLCDIAIKTRDYFISDENLKQINFWGQRVSFICIIVGQENFSQGPEIFVRNKTRVFIKEMNNRLKSENNRLDWG